MKGKSGKKEHHLKLLSKTFQRSWHCDKERDKDRSMLRTWQSIDGEKRTEKDENENGRFEIKRKIKENFKVDGFIAFWGHVKAALNITSNLDPTWLTPKSNLSHQDTQKHITKLITN